MAYSGFIPSWRREKKWKEKKRCSTDSTRRLLLPFVSAAEMRAARRCEEENARNNYTHCRESRIRIIFNRRHRLIFHRTARMILSFRGNLDSLHLKSYFWQPPLLQGQRGRQHGVGNEAPASDCRKSQMRHDSFEGDKKREENETEKSQTSLHWKIFISECRGSKLKQEICLKLHWMFTTHS